MNMLTPSTQAILLLTSYFSENRVKNIIPLSAEEWGGFAQWLHKHNLKPESLLEEGIETLLKDWSDESITITRLQALLERGGALALAMEKWQRAGIWVITRTSPLYPQQLKKRLQNISPALLYGIGNPKLLNKQSLGVESIQESSQEISSLFWKAGREIANDGYILVTDEVNKSAIKGALENGGNSIVFVANNLLQKSLNGAYREALIQNDLVLVSSYYPESVLSSNNALETSRYIQAHATSMVRVVPKSKNPPIQLSLFDNDTQEFTDLFFNFFISQLQYIPNDTFKPKELEILFSLKSSQITTWLEEAQERKIIKRLEGRVKRYQLVE